MVRGDEALVVSLSRRNISQDCKHKYKESERTVGWDVSLISQYIHNLRCCSSMHVHARDPVRQAVNDSTLASICYTVFILALIQP